MPCSISNKLCRLTPQLLVVLSVDTDAVAAGRNSASDLMTLFLTRYHTCRSTRLGSTLRPLRYSSSDQPIFCRHATCVSSLMPCCSRYSYGRVITTQITHRGSARVCVMDTCMFSPPTCSTFFSSPFRAPSTAKAYSRVVYLSTALVEPMSTSFCMTEVVSTARRAVEVSDFSRSTCKRKFCGGGGKAW